MASCAISLDTVTGFYGSYPLLNGCFKRPEKGGLEEGKGVRAASSRRERKGIFGIEVE